MSEKKLVRVFKVEIKKPLDRGWDEFGKDLRGLRTVAHRCMQGAMNNLIRYDTPDLEKPANERSGKGYSMQSLAYHGAQAALASYNKWAEKKKLDPVHVPGATISEWAAEAYTRWRKWVRRGQRVRERRAIPRIRRRTPASWLQ